MLLVAAALAGRGVSAGILRAQPRASWGLGAAVELREAHSVLSLALEVPSATAARLSPRVTESGEGGDQPLHRNQQE